jgi:hypothetical protein
VEYTPPRETLPTAASRANSEGLATHLVLIYSRMTFHPCTCGLREGAAAVAAALISYDDVEVAVGTTTRRRRA